MFIEDVEQPRKAVQNYLIKILWRVHQRRLKLDGVGHSGTQTTYADCSRFSLSSRCEMT